MMARKSALRVAAGVLLICAGMPVRASAQVVLGATLTLFDHRFAPTEIAVPAGKIFILQVRNQDRTVEQVECKDLGLEKLVPGGGEVSLKLGPVTPGAYVVRGAYHPDTAQARLIAK